MASSHRSKQRAPRRKPTHLAVEQLEPRRMLAGAASSLLEFDGVDDHVDIPTTVASDLQLANGAFTVEARIFPHTWGQKKQGRILDHGGGSLGEQGWTFQLMHSKKFVKEGLTLQINGQQFMSNAGVVALNQWQHVAATFDAGDLTFYVDGARVGEYTGVPTPIVRDEVVRIGMRATDSNRAFDGRMDDVGIWDRALSDQEILTRAGGGAVGPGDPGLEAFYRFDEGSDQTVGSLTGTHHGVLGTSDQAEPSDPAWVTAGNTRPIARDDSASVDQNATIDIGVLANDEDPDGQLDVTSVQIVTPPQHGQATVKSNGEITYQPNADYTGPDSFTYTVRDNLCLASNAAQVDVTVVPLNEPPVAKDDSAVTRVNTQAVIEVLKNDIDNDGTVDQSTVEVVQDPQHGSLQVGGDGQVTYTPVNDYAGDDSFRYTVKDDDGAVSNQALVNITVTPNQPPAAVDDDATLRVNSQAVINVLANDSDPDGTLDATSVSITQAPARGTANVGSDGKVTYTPEADFAGDDSFKYTVEDNEGKVSNVADVTLTVTPNAPPVAKNDQASLNENTQVVVEVLKNDEDSDGTLDVQSVTIVQDVQHGSLQVDNNGKVTYTPTADYTGADSFQYTVKDNEGAVSNTADVSLTVNPDTGDGSIIQDIQFDYSTLNKQAIGSDNWPMTWSDDGHQYTSWGDGVGFGGLDRKDKDGRVSLGYGRVEGSWDNFTGVNVWGGKNGLNPATFKGKSMGLISVGGVLYSFNMEEEGYFETSRVYYSTDKGASWTGANWTFDNLNSAFSVPTVVNFGQDNAGARDDYIYIYAPGSKDLAPEGNYPGENRFNSADTIDLARVHKNDILDRSQYEFFDGLDASNQPQWTSNVADREPVFTQAGKVHWTIQVSHLPGINRYLLFNNPGPGFDQSEKCGCLDIYEASEPWGPWTQVESFTDFGGDRYTFSHFVAPKWTSADGKEFTLVYSGARKNDAWNSVRATVVLK